MLRQPLAGDRDVHLQRGATEALRIKLRNRHRCDARSRIFGKHSVIRKLVTALVVTALVLFAIMAWRAETVFEDQRPEPATDFSAIGIDKAAAVQRFARALTFPTVSYDDRNQFDADAFRDLREFLESAYPLVNEQATLTVINGYSLVYELPGVDSALPPVLFMGHYDVVPIEENTRGEWTYPPFDGVVKDGVVWGRGSLDDKIGVIALMESLEKLLADGVRPQRSIYLAFGYDEEVGGMDGAARVAEYFERKGVRFDFVLDEGGAVTSGMMAGIDQPLAVVGISEKGYVNLVLTVDAPGGHSSQPPAQTALGVLARAIVRVEDHPFPARIDALLPTFEALALPCRSRNAWQ